MFAKPYKHPKNDNHNGFTTISRNDIFIKTNPIGFKTLGITDKDVQLIVEEKRRWKII